MYARMEKTTKSTLVRYFKKIWKIWNQKQNSEKFEFWFWTPLKSTKINLLFFEILLNVPEVRLRTGFPGVSCYTHCKIK